MVEFLNGRLALRMADGSMAVDAADRVVPRQSSAVGEFGVAVQAGRLRDVAVARLDPDRVRKVTRGEGEAVEEAVVRLGDPLPNGVMTQVTVVADGYGMVAGSQPTLVGVLHHVTVGAGRGVAAEVRSPSAVAKTEDAEPRKQTTGRAEGKQPTA